MFLERTFLIDSKGACDPLDRDSLLGVGVPETGDNLMLCIKLYDNLKISLHIRESLKLPLRTKY